MKPSVHVPRRFHAARLARAALEVIGGPRRWVTTRRERFRKLGNRLRPAIQTARSWVVSRAAYLLATLPLLTDWIDTGSLPREPREFVTEVIVGAVILVGVWRLQRRADRFQALSQTDSLTGLGNRARLRADLDAMLARARAVRAGICLAVIDVDRFKDVNDTFGHAAGDCVLREVGVALDRSVRQGVDGCYRLGGDEFAVLMFGVEAEHALLVLRRGFDRAARSIRKPVSCSIGIVSLRDCEDLDEFVKRADLFMYRAKQGDAWEGDEVHAFGRAELGTSEHDQEGRVTSTHSSEAGPAIASNTRPPSFDRESRLSSGP